MKSTNNILKIEMNKYKGKKTLRLISMLQRDQVYRVQRKKAEETKKAEEMNNEQLQFK